MNRALTQAEAVRRVAEWCERLPRCPVGHQAIGKLPVLESIDPQTGEVSRVLTYSHCTWCEEAA